MTREEYLATLRRALHTLPETDISDIARDFEEHFSIGLSQGKTEHEISAELGDPLSVAGTYFDEDLEDIGHTMKESAAHTAAAAAAAAAAVNRPAVMPAASGAQGNPGNASATPSSPAPAQVKDLTGPRLFVILFNLLVAWWIAITIYSTLLSFWCVSISLLIGGIGAFISIAAVTGEWIPILVLSGLAGVLLAAASGILNYFVTKWSIIGTKAYVNWNKKIYNEGF